MTIEETILNFLDSTPKSVLEISKGINVNCLTVKNKLFDLFCKNKINERLSKYFERNSVIRNEFTEQEYREYCKNHPNRDFGEY